MPQSDETIAPPVPVARPLTTPIARPIPVVYVPQLHAAPTDRLAIASAVCGCTAIIPVVSQLAGFGLGIAALVRIRRKRRAGLPARGTGWAVTGILTSGFALLSWLFMGLVLSAVGSVFQQSAGQFPLPLG